MQSLFYQWSDSQLLIFQETIRLKCTEKGSNEQYLQMENEVRKKKKAQNHKVTLVTKKLQGCSFQIKETQHAYFPYVPYPEQSFLVKKIHENIKNRENALIESPTGTGKTLCMLVGSLSCLSSLSLSETPNAKVPKIYYLTRTHSQITQVVNQLKRIPWYQCRINIIASREHLCINRNLKQLKGRMLDRGCQEMCKQKLCKFKQETSENAMPIKQWLTLEELCEKGNKQGFCPFYYSKMSAEKCQLTIMPFNYLLDWALLENNNFNLKNAVIIFDEAHNVDSLAEEGSSLQIDTQMLTQCLAQLKNLEQSSKCRYLHKKFDTPTDSSDLGYLNQMKSLLSRINSCLREEGQQDNFTDIEGMLRTMKKITNFVANEEEFKGVDLNNYEDILFAMEKVKKMFGHKKIDGDQFEIFCSVFSKIMKVLDSNYNNMEDYYMCIGPKSSRVFALKLNCLNASFTFQRIAEQKPRSIILCSGTLGSFDIWQKQLGMTFQTKLKVPSFITSRQVKVAIVEQSLNNKLRYEFSYQHKNKDGQFEAFAQQLREIEKVVPNGIVVAFSTYELMQKCMNQCSGLKKPVFFESKNQNVDRVYLKYSEAARSDKGAYIFIVMKGKFSEGINFNDQLCRCLIVVGIPFLPPNDYRVLRKKSYLQQKFGREASQQWYYAQTFKSVNQVIGRAIRSKQDYGCILLFDQRYGRKDIVRELPEWFVGGLGDGTGRYLKEIGMFFKNKPWLNAEVNQKLGTKHESSFDLALQMTKDTKPQSLQRLLEQQTPVKIKKPHKKTLKLDSDEDITQKIKVEPKQQPQIGEEETKKHHPVQKYPWLSLDYFIGDQIKEYIKESKGKLADKDRVKPIQQQDARVLPVYEVEKATLTFHTNRKRNKKYI